MDKILLLDDDPLQLEYLITLLRSDYSCESFTNPLNAIQSISEKQYSAIITDLHMPVCNGVEFIKKVRESNGNNLPIFVFSNDFSQLSKLNCLELNIKDYLHSSMCDEEIKLRIKNHVVNTRLLTYKDIVIDEVTMSVHINKEQIDLTQIEYKILVYLLRNQIKVEKKNLLHFIWPNRIVIEKTLNTHMTNLRVKIKPFNYSLITTKDDFVTLIPL